MSVHSPLIIIVGPTASGKSAAAMQVARAIGGEIICADSRTVYRGMDIGTAKPSAADRQAVPHHLLDIIDPSERMTAAHFKRLAVTTIDAIAAAGHIPVLVGGSGLYVDAVLFDYQFAPPPAEADRRQYEALGIEALQAEIRRHGHALPHNSANKRHLVRTLERAGAPPANRDAARPNTIIIGMALPKAHLAERIRGRVQAMLAAGLEQEARRLLERFGADAPGLAAIGYQEWLPYFSGTGDLVDVEPRIVAGTRQYAKRQLTWFKRNKSIQWLDDPSKVVDIVTTFLNTRHQHETDQSDTI